ncbi:MAG: hypothetical protein COW02_17805 [Comamonadaceae bacterium CG12_big_fil_rev_8_21_14_0_65_59_15]|nr:MAG: hypothetical protein COW02_17805 [Comamonadaceae bacterium CG12_big_fil_rev_8_21_14_0_65_59_15]
MAIGWLSVLKLVPWGDVIENAPKVAQGAKKLWGSVGKKPAPVAGGQSDVATTGEPSLAALQVQLADVQANVTELQRHLQQSSALIQSLAEQNTALVARVELNRKHQLWLAGVLAVLVVALILQLIR